MHQVRHLHPEPTAAAVLRPGPLVPHSLIPHISCYAQSGSHTRPSGLHSLQQLAGSHLTAILSTACPELTATLRAARHGLQVLS